MTIYQEFRSLFFWWMNIEDRIRANKCECGRVGYDVKLRTFNSGGGNIYHNVLCEACWDEELLELLD